MSPQASTAIAPEIPPPAVVLELLKPITWFPPMWAFCCGAISAGNPWQGHWPAILAGVLLCGPLLCASSQAVNDWFDRAVDAINQPTRPIPSGRMPGRWGLYVALLWSVLSMLCAAALGSRVFATSALGLALAWAYSAPPARLKQNGWWGNLACAVCYEGFAWVTGALVASGGAAASSVHGFGKIVAIAALYSLGAHGIMTLNDFKSIEGDRRMGVGSLPVRLGAETAAKVACVTMAFPQLIVIALLIVWGRAREAAAVAALLGVQLLLMRRLLANPRERAPWYNGTGVSLYVLGMMVSAFALRSLAP